MNACYSPHGLQAVMDMLDRLYLRFDRLSTEHGLFKVETIGDAYMAVANLPEPVQHDHARRVAEFAIQVCLTTLVVQRQCACSALPAVFPTLTSL